MLVLSRRPGEEVVIDGTIRVTILAVHGKRVRIGVTAPRSLLVDRGEIHGRRAGDSGRDTQASSRQEDRPQSAPFRP
jgi:carbon storage regulator